MYLKLNNPSDLTSGGDSPTFMIRNANVDLIDKIKVAINELKNINQKPRKTKAAKFLCSVCDKNCNINEDVIFCTHCDHWVYRKCNATSKQECTRLSNEPDDAPFQCLLCIMKESSQIFSFFFLRKSNLLDLNGIDLPSQLKLLKCYDFKSRLTNMPSLHDFDMDENLIHTVNSDYYDIITFPKTMKTKDCCSLFHVNLRSLSAHIDEMQALLTALKLRFDVIDVSETKEQAGGFLKDVTLSDYVMHSQH